MLLNPNYGILQYFAPLLLLFPKKLSFYKKTFSVILIIGIISILLDALFINDLLSSDHSTNNRPQGVVENLADLSYPVSFLLLTHIYHSKKINVFAFAVLILSLLFAIIRARRGLIFIFSSTLLLSYLVVMFSSSKKIPILFISILISLIATLFITTAYKQFSSGIFTFINERGTDDTRTGVELYFYDDFKGSDWIFGRGLSGEYFCPDADQTATTNFRDVIETGYLQIILKGGIISLGLLILISVPAIFLGLFYSRNLLSKVAALWIILRIIYSYPTMVNVFSLNYLLMWISIGICYSKEIRQIPEIILKDNLKKTSFFKRSFPFF